MACAFPKSKAAESAWNWRLNRRERNNAPSRLVVATHYVILRLGPVPFGEPDAGGTFEPAARRYGQVICSAARSGEREQAGRSGSPRPEDRDGAIEGIGESSGGSHARPRFRCRHE